LACFPDRNFNTADIDRYNKTMAAEYERVRDFLVLHYGSTERDDSEIWRYCRSVVKPDSLQERIELFRSHGRLLREDNELFPLQSWLYVFVGQNLMPQSDDPLVNILDPRQVLDNLNNIRSVIRQCVQVMPAHEEYIRQNCAASAVAAS
jgi:tryptophan halogenase